ncbi:hypothetical protein BDB00DRAFT_848254 [Zychaea mexicana]|uniref:uncharacterized protein n=1 Tax=Zychaea mexicana TaxID=64656 RepID=UPI0022FECEEB|nr:uncharacterized protein BDB00DRAFT_848254 [Zychaea mexicana]KAI9488395.1 hypothetical protein BDB00DRAFT_848254 [Zychaea mexicana]
MADSTPQQRLQEKQEEQEQEALLEQELKERLDVLLKDELLADVPSSPTIEQVDTLTAIEEGRAYRITVDRGPLEPLSIVVNQASSVNDIKRLIRNAIDRDRTATTTKTKISWKYIWRSHCLMFNGQRLLDNNAVVSQLGISQGSVLKFSRLAFEKGKHRRARRIR